MTVTKLHVERPDLVPSYVVVRGIGIPEKGICSELVGRSGWRVDLDNLNGWNLRQ